MATHKIKADVPDFEWAAGIGGELRPPTLDGYDHEFLPDDIGYPAWNVYDREVERV